MADFLCPNFRDSLENANEKVWALAKIKTSVKSAEKSVLDVITDASTISVISTLPAKAWLQNITLNGKDFINYFSGTSNGSSQELVQIYSRWKTNYELLNTYCSK